jgi:hypothetical protein
MSDQPEALSLADELDATSEHITRYTNSRGDSLCSAAATELRRQHSRIEADEALMRQALEALTETYNASAFPVGSLLLRGESITALRARLETSNV